MYDTYLSNYFEDRTPGTVVSFKSDPECIGVVVRVYAWQILLVRFADGLEDVAISWHNITLKSSDAASTAAPKLSSRHPSIAVSNNE